MNLGGVKLKFQVQPLEYRCRAEEDIRSDVCISEFCKILCFSTTSIVVVDLPRRLDSKLTALRIWVEYTSFRATMILLKITVLSESAMNLTSTVLVFARPFKLKAILRLCCVRYWKC